MTKTRDLTACFEDRHLPGEILSEILSRVPVKSLLRFRCVSKSWCSLVDDDGDFARLHLNMFKNNCDETRLFVFESGIDYTCAVRSSDIFESISETPIPFLHGHGRLSWWSIVSSVDGLILLKSRPNRRMGGKFNSLKLWNPSIREFRDVPPLPVCGDGGAWLTHIEIGLGYDPLSKDYKLVELIFARPTVLHSVAIYTVGSGSWKMIPFKGNGSSSSWPIWHSDWEFFPMSNVYLEGSLYFFAKNSDEIETRELVRFDLSKEAFSSIPLPDDLVFRWGVTLILIDGRSSVAVLNMHFDGKCVWVLERETMNWTKRFLFPLEYTRIFYVKKNDDILTLRIRREAISDEKTGNKLRETREEMVLYSPEKHEYKISPLKRVRYSGIKHVCGYVESLILHKRNINV